MTDRSIVIVVNPTSGRGRGRREADSVAKELSRRGIPVRVHATSGPGQAEKITREMVRDANVRPSCVVACGGDGTVQEVANALASLRPSLGNKCPTLGLAPAGRCNDFARALGVPANPVSLSAILAEGHTRGIDLGRVNDRYFCTVATLGVDAEVSRYVDAMRGPLSGTAAYLYGALRVLARYRSKEIRITGEFGEMQGRVFLASSANTSSYGGAIPIAPDAVPDDGLLDLCIIDHVSTWRALRIIPSVLAGRHGACPEVRFHRTTGFRIEADQPLEIWADGERIATTPATIEVVPHALQVALPPRSASAGTSAEDRQVAERG